MKFSPKTLNAATRAEIGEAVASLEKAIKRAQRNGADALKLNDQMEALEEEHAALAGKRTLSRSEATDTSAIIQMKGRLASSIEDAEAASEEHRKAVGYILHAVQPLVARLLDMAVRQIRGELEILLAPYFLQTGNLSYIASQTELESHLVAHFRRPFSGLNPSLAEVVESAETARTILSDIAEGNDFFSFLPVAAKAA